MGMPSRLRRRAARIEEYDPTEAAVLRSLADTRARQVAEEAAARVVAARASAERAYAERQAAWEERSRAAAERRRAAPPTDEPLEGEQCDRCERCGTRVSHLGVGFSPARCGMVHRGCGGRFVVAEVSP